jgi:flagellar protein FlaJ
LSLEGIATVLFGGVGGFVSRWCGDLEAADIRIYPPAYGSMVVLSTVASVFVALIGSVVLIALGVFDLPVATVVFLLPILTFGFGLLWPRIKMADRGSSLSSEVPYAAAYTAVMSTGGISPYSSMLRLSRAPLLPTFRKMAGVMDIKVRGLGYDPVSGMEEMGKTMPSVEFKELLLGYASTLRAGGDVVHFLLRKTEVLFTERVVSLKRVADNVGQLMEIYITFGILLSLGMYSIYSIQMALGEAFPAMAGGIFGSAEFFMGFSYVFLPFLSFLFLWLVDMSQPKYPAEQNDIYILFLATAIPIGLLLLPGFFLALAYPDLQKIEFLGIASSYVTSFTRYLGLEMGYEPTIGLIISLVAMTIPALVYRSYIDWKEKGMEFGFANFVRDLVETRKSGLSPEKCIANLVDRDYGNLSKHIRTVSKQVSWGISYSKVYEGFSKSVRSWLTKVSMFLLLDAIEVGGGTPETLETLASFNESMVSMEKEKRSMLRPLLVIPYIGAAILVIVVITLLTFFRSMLMMVGTSIGFAQITRLLLPPLVIHVYLMGIVGGKIANGETSAGFAHAILLLLFIFVVLVLSPYYSLNIPLGQAG